jgi:MscS family membrane protein
VTGSVGRFIEKRFPDNIIFDKELVSKTIRPIYWMLSIIFFLIFASVVIKLFDFKEDIYKQILNVIPTIKSLVIVLFVTLSILIFIKLFQKKYIVFRRHSGVAVDIQKIDMFSKLCSVLVMVCAAVPIMQILGVGFGAIAAIGGLSGLVIGFSTKDLFTNFFGLFSVYLDRPFEIGDEITILDKGINGVVEEIGLRTTTIRTSNNKTAVYLPNSIFNTLIIENNSRILNKIFLQEFKVVCRDLSSLDHFFDVMKVELKNFSFVNKDMNSIIRIIDLNNKEAIISFKIFFDPMGGEDFAYNSNKIMRFIFDKFKENNIKVIDKNAKFIVREG